MRRAYLFIYSRAVGGREAVKGWANEEPAVLYWRYDIPHSFYIISEESAAFLSKSFIAQNRQQGRFLIVEVGDNRQGWLPKEAWYLLRNKRRMSKQHE